MLEIDRSWTFASSGGGAVVQGSGFEVQQMWHLEAPGSTVTVEIQSAASSGGPWAVDHSTSLAANGVTVVRIAGPVMFARPHVNVNAAVKVRLVATSGD